MSETAKWRELLDALRIHFDHGKQNPHWDSIAAEVERIEAEAKDDAATFNLTVRSQHDAEAEVEMIEELLGQTRRELEYADERILTLRGEVEDMEAVCILAQEVHRGAEERIKQYAEDRMAADLLRDREWSNRLESQDTLHPDSPDLDIAIAWYAHSRALVRR